MGFIQNSIKEGVGKLLSDCGWENTDGELTFWRKEKKSAQFTKDHELIVHNDDVFVFQEHIDIVAESELFMAYLNYAQ